MSKLILVNEEKATRAKAIVALVRGSVAPKNEADIDNQRKFTAMLQSEGLMEEEAEEQVEFVYRKLGGLVRTEAEQREALRRQKATKEDKRKVLN